MLTATDEEHLTERSGKHRGFESLIAHMDEADIYIKLSEAAAIARQKRLENNLSEEERLRLISMVLDIEKIKEKYFELEVIDEEDR